MPDVNHQGPLLPSWLLEVSGTQSLLGQGESYDMNTSPAEHLELPEECARTHGLGATWGKVLQPILITASCTRVSEPVGRS